MENTVFTVAELAKRWSCSIDIVYDLLKKRTLKGFRLGGAWRISAAEVARYESGE